MTKTPKEKLALKKKAIKKAKAKWEAKIMADPIKFNEWRKKKSECVKKWKEKLTGEQLQKYKEYHRIKSKEWKKANREKANEAYKKWTKANPEKEAAIRTRSRLSRNARHKISPISYIVANNRGLSMKDTPSEIIETITLLSKLKRITKKQNKNETKQTTANTAS